MLPAFLPRVGEMPAGREGLRADDKRYCDAVRRGMLTIIMECRDNEAELVQTLSVLVAGAVEGLVRDVIVLDHGSRDGSAAVADAAGCRFLDTWELGEVLGAARGEWLLLLEPGARPLSGWVEAIADHVAAHPGPACLRAARKRPFFQRLARKLPLEEGYLIARHQASAAVRPGMDLADLAKGARARRLAAEIAPAWATRALRAG